MRSKILFIISALIVLAIITCTSIVAQQPANPSAVKATEKQQDKEALIKADWYRQDLVKKTTLLKGNVKCIHLDTVLTSDEVVFDKKTNEATSPGKVVITSPESDITGDKGVAYFNKRLTVLEGNVVMNLKPKKTEEDKNLDKDSIKAKAKESPSIINCAKLEYQYKTKIATATGGVKLKQDKRSASADKAIYDEKKELLTLIGNVKGTDEDGQTFAAPKVIISNKKGDEWIEAPNATATFKVNLEEDEEQKPQ